MRRLELGVFLPIGKNGFIISTQSPAYAPRYETNRAISVVAEEIGLDYVFSMAKWRGFGGPSNFWDSSLESFTLMSTLVPATTRLRLIATVNPLLYHPALMAKMAATTDEASGGRLGLNIITGSALQEYSQMGVLPDDYDKNRYAYATEWVQVLKRLWHEERVTHDGRYFHLEDCVSEPKPIQRPHPFLVCAGTSDEGLSFTAREADYAFLGGNTLGDIKAMSLRAKAIASQAGRTIKTATTRLILLANSTTDAQREWERYITGADLEAIANIGRSYRRESRQGIHQRGETFLEQPSRISYVGDPLLGSPQAIADELIGLATDGQVDSILLIFPEYLEGLRRFGQSVMPILRNSLDIGTPVAA